MGGPVHLKVVATATHAHSPRKQVRVGTAFPLLVVRSGSRCTGNSATAGVNALTFHSVSVYPGSLCPLLARVSDIPALPSTALAQRICIERAKRKRHFTQRNLGKAGLIQPAALLK